MNNNRFAIIISLISLLGVVSIGVLWFAGAFKLSVVSLDSFVGVIVALLAIIVTIVLGWQIINALEWKERVKMLERNHIDILEKERKLAENDLLFVKESHNLQAGLCDINGASFEDSRQFVYAFASYHSALAQAILAGQSGLDNRMATLKRICMQVCPGSVIPSPVISQQLEKDVNLIRSTDAYRLYFSKEYDEMIKLFNSKVLGI